MRVTAPAVCFFHGWPFLWGGMTATAPCAADGRVTGVGVIGAIGRDPADGLFGRGLVQRAGHHGRVADPATGDLDRQDFQRIRVDPKMDLAPLSGLGWPMFLGKPLAIAFGFYTGAVDQQAQRSGAGTKGDTDRQRLLPTTERAEVGHRPIDPASSSRLATIPPVCRSGSPNRAFSIRQAWIAASLNVGCRPRLLVGSASHRVSGSNQISSDPRFAKAAL